MTSSAVSCITYVKPSVMLASLGGRLRVVSYSAGVEATRLVTVSVIVRALMTLYEFIFLLLVIDVMRGCRLRQGRQSLHYRNQERQQRLK